MDDDVVLAPAGTKRVGGKVNPMDKKSGFTVMMMVEMFSNSICDPFIVFTGTKKESKRPMGTLDFKYVLLFLLLYVSIHHYYSTL